MTGCDLVRTEYHASPIVRLKLACRPCFFISRMSFLSALLWQRLTRRGYMLAAELAWIILFCSPGLCGVGFLFCARFLLGRHVVSKPPVKKSRLVKQHALHMAELGVLEAAARTCPALRHANLPSPSQK